MRTKGDAPLILLLKTLLFQASLFCFYYFDGNISTSSLLNGLFRVRDVRGQGAVRSLDTTGFILHVSHNNEDLVSQGCNKCFLLPSIFLSGSFFLNQLKQAEPFSTLPIQTQRLFVSPQKEIS